MLKNCRDVQSSAPSTWIRTMCDKFRQRQQRQCYRGQETKNTSQRNYGKYDLSACSLHLYKFVKICDITNMMKSFMKGMKSTARNVKWCMVALQSNFQSHWCGWKIKVAVTHCTQWYVVNLLSLASNVLQLTTHFVPAFFCKSTGKLKLIYPSVCHKKINLSNIFWIINDRALISGMYDPCDKLSQFVPCFDLDLWPS